MKSKIPKIGSILKRSDNIIILILDEDCYGECYVYLSGHEGALRIYRKHYYYEDVADGEVKWL